MRPIMCEFIDLPVGDMPLFIARTAAWKSVCILRSGQKSEGSAPVRLVQSHAQLWEIESRRAFE